MVVARVFPVVNLASVFLWSRLVDTHARAMLNFYGHKNSSIYVGTVNNLAQIPAGDRQPSA